MYDLKQFNEYLDSNEFSFISDKIMIKKLKLMLSVFENGPKHQVEVEAFVEKYIKCFNKVINEVGDNIVTLNHAKNSIERIKSSKDREKEIDIALEYLYKGLKIAFKPENLNRTKIKKETILNYITSRESKIHKKFRYNKNGKDSFYNKIKKLDKSKLLEVIKLLQDRSFKKVKEWSVLSNKELTIIGIKHSIFSSKLYSLFTSQEESKIKKILDVDPKKKEFVECD